jgi:hypothetical protein
MASTASRHPVPGHRDEERVLSHPDCHGRSRTFTVSTPGWRPEGRGLYRRWGITPRPEDELFSCEEKYTVG